MNIESINDNENLTKQNNNTLISNKYPYMCHYDRIEFVNLKEEDSKNYFKKNQIISGITNELLTSGLVMYHFCICHNCKSALFQNDKDK